MASHSRGTVRQWIAGVRLRTLSAGIAAVFIGGAAAIVDDSTLVNVIASFGADLVWRTSYLVLFFLALVVAVGLQIAVNFANDYSDGIRGTDAGRTGAGRAENNSEHLEKTEQTDRQSPIVETDKFVSSAFFTFSVSPANRASSVNLDTPSRLVASGVEQKLVLRAAVVAAGISCLTGLFACIISGRWLLLFVGIVSVIAAWFYTGGKNPYGYAGFGELAVFVFFGLVAVLGTEFLLTGEIGIAGFGGAIVSGLSSCAVLLVNNIRDIKSDEMSGKKTLAVRMGYSASLTLLLFFSEAAFGIAFLGTLDFIKYGFSPILSIVPGLVITILINRIIARCNPPLEGESLYGLRKKALQPFPAQLMFSLASLQCVLLAFPFVVLAATFF